MIVEFFGAPGVGKTTVAALVAETLGLKLFSTRGFQSIDGLRVPKGRRRWAQRLTAVATRPALTMATASLAANLGRGKMISAALDMARRDRWAANVARAYDTAIVDGGPLHVLCMIAASTGRNADRPARRITRPGAAVLMLANVTEISRRVAERDVRKIRGHTWTESYQSFARRVSGLAGVPVIEIDAMPAAEVVGAAVAQRLKHYL